jgi:amidase
MDLTFQTAGKIRAAIAAGKLSCLEVTDHFIKRIETHDGTLNAVVVRDFERARTRAKQLDRQRKKLAKLPSLFGVPMTVKESYDVAGLPTCWGLPAFAGNIAHEDALSIARLKDQGAIILGKTNVPVLLADWQSFNPVYGSTNNPWDIARSPGGSSGGSAASLAAGFCALEAGSDIGASIRDPAHYCGVYGHKPTWGVIPPRGHSLAGNHTTTDLSVIGPLARSAADLATALAAMAGPEAIDCGFKLDLPKPRVRSLQDLRIAVMADSPICPVATEISAEFGALAKFLRKSGAKVSETARPAFDMRQAHVNYSLLLNAALSARMPDETIKRLRHVLDGKAADDLSPDVVVARGTLLEHRLWLREHEARYRMRAAWAAFFQDWDVLIAPVGSTAALPHDQSGPMWQRFIDVNGKQQNFADQLFWAGLATNPLLPATAAPLGFTKSGLPFGMQILGAPFADRTTIAVAAMLEKSWLGFEVPPGY